MHLEDLIRNKLSMTQHHQDCHVFNRMICKIERFRSYCLKGFLSNFYITFIMINTSRKFCLYFSFTFENCFFFILFLKSRTFSKIYFFEKWLKNRNYACHEKLFFQKQQAYTINRKEEKNIILILVYEMLGYDFSLILCRMIIFFKAYVFLSFASE